MVEWAFCSVDAWGERLRGEGKMEVSGSMGLVVFVRGGVVIAIDGGGSELGVKEARCGGVCHGDAVGLVETHVMEAVEAGVEEDGAEAAIVVFDEDAGSGDEVVVETWEGGDGGGGYDALAVADDEGRDVLGAEEGLEMAVETLLEQAHGVAPCIVEGEAAEDELGDGFLLAAVGAAQLKVRGQGEGKRGKLLQVPGKALPAHQFHVD